MAKRCCFVSLVDAPALHWPDQAAPSLLRARAALLSFASRISIAIPSHFYFVVFYSVYRRNGIKWCCVVVLWAAPDHFGFAVGRTLYSSCQPGSDCAIFATPTNDSCNGQQQLWTMRVSSNTCDRTVSSECGLIRRIWRLNHSEITIHNRDTSIPPKYSHFFSKFSLRPL